MDASGNEGFVALRFTGRQRLAEWASGMPKIGNLFSNRSIGVKLAAMTIVGAICMALVASTVLLVARSQLITERTEKAHAIVDPVCQMPDAFPHPPAAAHIPTEP